jgi:glutamate/aspartate transport system substrate-binding protein
MKCLHGIGTHLRGSHLASLDLASLGPAILALAAVILSGQASAQELTGTLKKIKETGAITLGYRDSSIPFSYLDADQKPVGFAMDICGKVSTP